MTMILDSVDVSAAALGNLDLKPEQHRQVIFSRYESHDPMVTDTIHGDLWVEEYVVSEHLGLVEDDGCIIRLHGTPRGQVGIAKTGDVLTDEQADQREEMGGEAIQRYAAYDFRIAWIKKTDGPERREKLVMAAETRKQDSEKDMYSSIATAFQNAMAQSGNSGPMSHSQMQEALNNYTPDQIRAMADMADINSDDDSPEAGEDSGGDGGGDIDGTTIGAAVKEALAVSGDSKKGKRK